MNRCLDLYVQPVYYRLGKGLGHTSTRRRAGKSCYPLRPDGENTNYLHGPAGIEVANCTEGGGAASLTVASTSSGTAMRKFLGRE